MSSIPSSTLQQKIGVILRRVAVDGEHITIERNSYPIVVIIPVGDYKSLLESRNTPQPVDSSKTPKKQSDTSK